MHASSPPSQARMSFVSSPMRGAVRVEGRLGEVDCAAEPAHGAHDLVLVAGDEPEALVVGIEEHEVAALRVDGDLVGDADVVEVVAPAHRGAACRTRAQNVAR